MRGCGPCWAELHGTFDIHPCGCYNSRVSVERGNLWKTLSDERRLIVIAGPCVIESEKLCMRIAETLATACRRLGITYIFKASYDKANRTSARSFRGPGLDAGLQKAHY